MSVLIFSKGKLHACVKTDGYDLMIFMNLKNACLKFLMFDGFDNGWLLHSHALNQKVRKAGEKN